MNNGYDLVDGSKDTAIGIKPQKLERKPKLNTPYPNYSTVTDFVAKDDLMFKSVYFLF